MSQRIPNLIQPTLQDYLSMLDEHLPGLIKAVYLEGSIALGGFNERFSDIDFVAVLDRQPKSAEIYTLRSIHKAIGKRYSRWEMQCSYVQSEGLHHCVNKAGPDLYYHDGELSLSSCFDPQSVEGWILKHHGIAVMGPDAQDLPFTVDWDLLIAKMRKNLNTYWVGWSKRPDRFVVMLSDWGIQWAVLGVLRQFYSFRENSITTKASAGNYALTCVPEHGHRLIRESLAIRESKTTAAFRSDVTRAINAVRFLKFIIHTCNVENADVPEYESF